LTWANAAIRILAGFVGAALAIGALATAAPLTPVRGARAAPTAIYTGPGARRALLRNRRFELAFIRGRRARGPQSVVVATRAGRPERLFIGSGKWISDFNWTQRGASLLYVVGSEGGSFEVRPDGSLGPPKNEPACFSAPDPARDGTFLSCSADSVELHRGGQVETLVVEGNNAGFDSAATLSRDGRRVAIARFFAVEPLESWLTVYFVSAETRARRLDPLSPRWEYREPALSPDGKRIAFWAKREEPRAEGVFVVNVDGTRLTRISLDARHPAWSPDGRLLAFDRKTPRGGRRQIVVARANGTSLRTVTRGSMGSWRPRWRPRTG
jgi:WD40-like Beta Propeller Repeat